MSGRDIYLSPIGDPTMYILTHKQSKGISSITEYEKLSILRNWRHKTLAVNWSRRACVRHTWTGSALMDLSGEKYNVVIGIKEIVRHPNFNPKEGAGPIGGSDIAVFKVDDSTIQNRANSLRLWPICLPTAEKQKSGERTAIHAGWSKPPPFHFVEEQATGYLRFYRDFFKQWHYKMEILDKCQDPQLNGLYGGELEFPSNTSYPAGTVCAKDFSRQSCFSTGDSGSPLMVREETRPMRFYAEGISSFVKGCDVFTFGASDENRTKWQLNQQSENPSTYTKLSCFLPWVAEQYGLEYKVSDPTDPACYESQGDPEDGENTCRITPSNQIDVFTGEVECIFPFYYNGKEYNKCVLFDESGFVFPVFRCPTRESTVKINGISSYPTIGLTEGLCPSVQDPEVLDPERGDCDDFARRATFSQCKNNCPGGIQTIFYFHFSTTSSTYLDYSESFWHNWRRSHSGICRSHHRYSAIRTCSHRTWYHR